MGYKRSNIKILLTGGSSGGSVSPLLALADELRQDSRFNGVSFLWLGTIGGPERGMVEKVKIAFRTIAHGKLRRYFSVKNAIDILFIIIGFFQALAIIIKWKPDLIMSAGSFVSVPVVWAGWLLRAPILIHQQDIMPGLANKLMAPFAKVITVTFEKSLADYGKKAVWTGNPVRKELRITKDELRRTNYEGRIDDFSSNLPAVFILGGGTGALAINDLVEQSFDELTKFCRIIHVTGKDRKVRSIRLRQGFGGQVKYEVRNYKSFEFLNAEQMASAYDSADVVVSRAGLGTLTELSYLGKPAILIPMPDSHQEENAKLFEKSAVVLKQAGLDHDKFTKEIKKLLDSAVLRNKLSENIKKVIKSGANENIVKLISDMLIKDH